MHKGVEQAAEQDGGAQAETGGGSGDVPPPLDRFGTTGLATTGLWGRISYSFVTPLLTLGARGKVDEGSADAYLPQWETAEVVAAQFDAAYQHEVAKQASRPHPLSPTAILWRTYFALYHRLMAVHLFWTVAESGVRVGAPIVMRELISFFSGWERSGGNQELYPVWTGWMWAGLLAVFGYAYTLMHHQLFFIGMRMGMRMRQQAIAAVQSKVLRLNSVAVSDVTAGKIVNLVSNDVRRMDDACAFYIFLVGGPLELIIVFVLVGLKLGFLSSFCGIATLLAIIPAQGALVQFIGKLRSATATQTDERVRLMGETIGGMLAAKLLGWESPLSQQVYAIRQAEVRPLRRMATIRALNMALSYAIAPLVSFVTFAVAHATANGAYLTVPNVFYAVALLSLLKLSVADFMVHAVESVSELRISMQRLGEFLSLPEPPAPWHEDRRSNSTLARQPLQLSPSSSTTSLDAPAVSVAASFDWSDRSWAKEGAGTSGSVPRAQPAGGPTAGSSTSESLQQQQQQQLGEHETSGGFAASGPTLPGLELAVPRGQLLAIVGAVGTGKSSVLAALLGELQPMRASSDGSNSGSGGGSAHRSPVVVRGRVAYCSQVPWIMSGSVRENILFGQAFDRQRYERVLKASALSEDLAVLPAGDATELGERGINLSGGQKARLALARAAYSQAAVQLLDDPLSAVDPRVGKVLFEQCIAGVMAGTTRLLVTHQRQYLAGCDRVVVLRQGRIEHAGTYAELAALQVPEVLVSQETELDDSSYSAHAGGEEGSGSPLEHEQQHDSEGEGDARTEEEDEQDGEAREVPEAQRKVSRIGFDRVVSLVFETDEQAAPPPPTGKGADEAVGGSTKTLLRGVGGSTLRRFVSQRVLRRRGGGSSMPTGKQAPGGQQQPQLAAEPTKSGQLTMAEDRAVGAVSSAIYWQYASQMGVGVVLLIAVGLAAGEALTVLSNYWLALWASKTPEQQQAAYWVWGYAILAVGVLLISIVRSLLFFRGMLRASTRVHNAMVERVLHAPLAFFHTNPTGRILNRFSKDQGSVDEQLPVVFFDAVQALLMVLGAFILLIIVVPWILPVLAPLAIAFYFVRRRYLATSREIKRFEAVTRSPVFASFSAILKGLPTIRAYGVGARFRDIFLLDLSHNGAWWFCFLTTARWIGFRLDVLVALLMTAAPLLMMAVHEKISARLAGLALTQSLQLGGMLQWMVRQSAEAENNMTSVERMLHYTRLDQEPPTVAEGGGKPPEGWPSAGRIEFRHVTCIYRTGLPPVLRDLDFVLEGGASCGVVGRTGSGKSSLMLALMRLIPLTSGTIAIDSVDTSRIGLDALRHQIAIVPQDPVLFSGTLRSNLDPWARFADARLWEVLRMVQLGAAIQGLGGLDARMQEAGDNLSVGQRQLFALARALLQDSAVLALDEATANVDRGTDALIQQAVRNVRKGGDGTRQRTLLVIAHRIDTILDCDQLLVLSAGRVVEQGPPAQLVRSGGVFARLVGAAREAAQTG